VLLADTDLVIDFLSGAGVAVIRRAQAAALESLTT
jgi:hypothetical protein